MEQAAGRDTYWLQKLAALEQLENIILQQNADFSIRLPGIIVTYLKGLESMFPGMRCVVIPVSKDHLDKSISPSFTEDELVQLQGLPLTAKGNPAIEWDQPLIAEKINGDPKWKQHPLLNWQPEAHSCWMHPLINSDRHLMALLAAYDFTTSIDYKERTRVLERTTGLLRIILENRQKTEIIRETNMLMHQSQELAHFGNWRWDIRQDVIAWSPVLYTIYGLDPETFSATFEGYKAKVHPEDWENVYRVIKRVLRNGGEMSFEERIIRPDGEIRYLRSWAKLVTDTDGSPLEMIGACLDITERVNQQEEIERQERELEDINEERARMLLTLTALEQSQADNTRMLKVVSHDLRHPIGAAKMAAELLLMEGQYSDKQKSLLDIIERSTDNALELVSELLGMQGRTHELKKEPVELSAMLQYCTDLLRHQADAKKQRITIQLVPVTVAASREKLWRVMSNLIANAIKFSPKETDIVISLSTDKLRAIIKVTDQGIGIAPEMLDKLFSMPAEAMRTGTAGEASYGMGLAISKQIIDAHGGNMWVESEPGEGSAFYVELPLA
jgi:PAS domain S-box-containing protein